MSTIPTQIENPNGLHQKYLIKKLKVVKDVLAFNISNDRAVMSEEHIIAVLPEPNEEYFILRLDDNGKDKTHIEACRKAVLYYAELIKDHTPQLSADLIERYAGKDDKDKNNQL